MFGALGPSYPHSQLRVASACDARGHLPPQRLFQTALPIVRRRVVAPPLPPRSQHRSPKKVHHPPWLRRALSHRGQRHVAKQVPGRTATHHPRSPLRRRCNQDEYLTERSTLDNPLPLRGPSQVEGAKRFAASEPALRATRVWAQHPGSRAGWATGRRSSGASGARSRVLCGLARRQQTLEQPPARRKTRS